MAVAPLTVTAEREMAVDFVQPFIEDGVGILTKKPDMGQDELTKVYVSVYLNSEIHLTL